MRPFLAAGRNWVGFLGHTIPPRGRSRACRLAVLTLVPLGWGAATSRAFLINSFERLRQSRERIAIRCDTAFCRSRFDREFCALLQRLDEMGLFCRVLDPGIGPFGNESKPRSRDFGLCSGLL